MGDFIMKYLQVIKEVNSLNNGSDDHLIKGELLTMREAVLMNLDIEKAIRVNILNPVMLSQHDTFDSFGARFAMNEGYQHHNNGVN